MKREKFLTDIRQLLLSTEPINFHTLEKIRGRAVSFSHVIPQMRMYIREMSYCLTKAENGLEPFLHLTAELEQELGSWLEEAHFLSNERSFDDFHEIDVVMQNIIPDYEYMSDASDFAIGIYDCNSKKTMRRQFSLQEGEKINIAGKEALAVRMVLNNIPLDPPPRHLRLHVDNQGKVFKLPYNGKGDLRGYLF